MTAKTLNLSTVDDAFDITVKRLADDLRYGAEISRYAGTGIDYLQSRPFVDGDQVKDIDWRVTARTRRYHVREYESLRCTPVFVVVDTSASMAISSTSFSKQTLASLLAGGLALAAQRQLSPVGLVAAGDRGQMVTPSLSRGRVLQWLYDLRHHHYREQTRLGQRLDELSTLLKSVSLVLVITDLHEPDVVSLLKRIAQRHDCVVLHVQDPAERGNLRGGVMRAHEAETGRTFVAHGRSRWFHKEEERPEQQLKKAAIDYLPLWTDKPFVHPLRLFLRQRTQGARRAGG